MAVVEAISATLPTYTLWGVTLPRPSDKPTFQVSGINHNKKGALRLLRVIQLWKRRTKRHRYPSDILKYERRLMRARTKPKSTKRSQNYVKEISRDGRREIWYTKDQKENKDRLHVTCFHNKPKRWDCHGTVQDAHRRCHYGYSDVNPYCKERCEAKFWPRHHCPVDTMRIVAPYFRKWRKTIGY